MTTVVWFRQDLRLADNPALFHAAARGPVVPVYILEEGTGTGAGPRPRGGASRWWLHHSLAALDRSLGSLLLMRGDPATVLRDLAATTGASAVHWNRCYEPQSIARDKALKATLRADGLDVRGFNGALLHEPWEVKTGNGDPFKMFSPFWRAAQKHLVSAPLPTPTLTRSNGGVTGDSLDAWDLLPENPDWADGWSDRWQPGEAAARARLEAFLADGIAGYGSLRDRPDRPNVSRLSPHLHFGEISPRQIWARTGVEGQSRSELHKDLDKFLSELGWREFSCQLLYHFPSLPQDNWRTAFDAYPWRDCEDDLRAWQRGMTGYPFVDAGLRELWQTGYMHNRVRMVAASFLVKHLRIHWRRGEDWFWDTLVDADMANNAAGWQWVAGSGADAAPYFRIFNPVAQGRKFDPDGAYVRRWCPELAGLGNDLIHAPFAASEETLAKAGVRLGITYPEPIVEHATARALALDGYNAVKGQGKRLIRRKFRLQPLAVFSSS